MLYYRYLLRPHLPADVTEVDMRIQLCGMELAFPIFVSPTALQCVVHPEGESATAKGNSHIQFHSSHICQ